MIETGTQLDAAGIAAPLAAADATGAKETKAAAITKIVVAIHGIGKQYRSETIRSVAHRFGDGCKPALPVLPLGYFNIPDGSKVRWSQLETEDPALRAIGFAEVFWADIPAQLVHANDTLEETKAWARTVVSRAERVYNKKVRKVRGEDALLADCDFRQGIDAVDTLVEGVAVIERLAGLAARAGGPAFDVGALLRDFAGDVQTVTEFPHYRNKILYRFHAALNAIVGAFRDVHGRDPEIYLVAHSEGTVIGLLALLQALSSMEIADPDRSGKTADGGWVAHMHGFMTLGSPIDKHIALWPELWQDFAFTTTKIDGRLTVSATRPGAAPVTLARRIKWRNYFDFGDPVGFRLDEAQRMLERVHCDAFEFDPYKHDVGYSRYWWPGKAHVDYWQDADLFRHFIATVVKPAPGSAPPEVAPPRSKRLCDIFAKWVPYTFAFILHVMAVATLLAALSLASFQAAASLATLLAAVTVAARLPRLVRPAPRWGVLAALCLGLGMAATWRWLPTGLAEGIGRAFADLAGAAPASFAATGKLALCGAAAAAVLAAWLVPRADGACWWRAASCSPSASCCSAAAGSKASASSTRWPACPSSTCGGSASWCSTWPSSGTATSARPCACAPCATGSAARTSRSIRGKASAPGRTSSARRSRRSSATFDKGEYGMRIAFASCICTHAFSDQPVWNRIAQEDPDYLVLLGDLLYLDINTVPHPIDMNIDEFTHLAHTRYLQLLRQPQFRSLVMKMGPGRVFATWDDHDFLWDNAHGASVRNTPTQADKIDRSTALHAALRKALATGLAPGSFPAQYSDPVFWQAGQGALDTPSVALPGKVVLHISDARTWRTPLLGVAAEKRTMLGAAQRDRLGAAIGSRSADTIHLFASATTLNDWRHYPADLAWLRALAARHRILVLSGDVHENRAVRHDTGGLGLHEITSSGAAVCTGVTVGSKQQNFGLLDIDGQAVSARLYHFGQRQTELDRTYDPVAWEEAAPVGPAVGATVDG